MSLASEDHSAAGVIQHSAPRPAVLIPSHPSEEELAFNWTLSERDVDFIMTNHRGPENLCRLAIQLCVLRQHGRFLANYTHVPPPILASYQQLNHEPQTSSNMLLIHGFKNRDLAFLANGIGCRTRCCQIDRSHFVRAFAANSFLDFSALTVKP